MDDLCRGRSPENWKTSVSAFSPLDLTPIAAIACSLNLSSLLLLPSSFPTQKRVTYMYFLFIYEQHKKHDFPRLPPVLLSSYLTLHLLSVSQLCSRLFFVCEFFRTLVPCFTALLLTPVFWLLFDTTPQPFHPPPPLPFHPPSAISPLLSYFNPPPLPFEWF